MRKIDTKDKGDLGIAMVIAALAKKNIKVALPMCEHLPFDLIGISEQGKLSRISIKYRTAVDGLIEVPIRTISSNSQGYKVKYADLNDIDGFAVYCPTTDQVYFINSERLKGFTSGMILRIQEEDKFKKRRHLINWANDFLNPDVLFKMEESAGLSPAPPLMSGLVRGSSSVPQ